MIEAQENPPTPQEEAPQITLTISHSAAVAIAAAAIHYRVWLAESPDSAPIIANLDSAYHAIREHPELSAVAKETLRDIRLVVAGQRE